MSILKKSTNVRQFIEQSIYFDMEEELNYIKEHKLPEKICGFELPKTLDLITFGMRLDLSEIKNDFDFYFKPLMLLGGLRKEQILICNAYDVIAFGFLVSKELTRLNERDSKLKYKFDKEEERAGIHLLNHGIFGTIDMIAKRMNISHDDVLELSQQKVYMMMKIDIDNANYQKRLRDVLNNQ